MVTAYTDYLASGKLGEAIVNSSFGWTEYTELHSAATGRGFVAREEAHFVVTFGTSNTQLPLAQDVLKETVGGVTLVQEHTAVPRDPNGNRDPDLIHNDGATIHYKDDPYTLYARLTGQELSSTVDACFQDLKNAIHIAKSPQAQLLAIACLIRRLHILHAFEDGCGRTNVFLLLPALLLRLGFGVPLGRDKKEDELTKKALYELFNGGYTLEQIAKYLWLAQDFGLDAHRRGEKTAITVGS